jgi:hypothetical protein
MCLESSFGFFSEGQLDLMITRSEVQAGKLGCTMQFIEELFYDRNRVLGLCSNSVIENQHKSKTSHLSFSQAGPTRRMDCCCVE